MLETHVSINTGTMLGGNLGSRRRFDYTVNTAARLEELNKMLGTSILVSQSVIERCAEPAHLLQRRMGSFVVKGKKRETIVFEILGFSSDPEAAIRTRKKAYLDFYQQGLDASMNGDPTAEAFFRKSLLLHDRLPECPASRLHLAAIEASRTESREWRGEIVLDSK